VTGSTGADGPEEEKVKQGGDTANKDVWTIKTTKNKGTIGLEGRNEKKGGGKGGST